MGAMAVVRGKALAVMAAERAVGVMVVVAMAEVVALAVVTARG